jgi:hypothetical protein
MKKLSLIAIGITSAVFSFAQTPAKFGVKAGLNISNIEWSNNTDSRLGLHGGLFAHIHLARQWALQPELLYSAEGAKKDFGNGEEATYVNDYVNIPLMLQYMFNNGFRIEAGPQLGILTRAKIKDQDEAEDENDEAFKSTNIGVGFGLNYLSQTGFGVGGRYNLGLNKINEEGFIDAKGRAFQISLFYMFDNAHKAKSR